MGRRRMPGSSTPTRPTPPSTPPRPIQELFQTPRTLPPTPPSPPSRGTHPTPPTTSRATLRTSSTSARFGRVSSTPTGIGETVTTPEKNERTRKPRQRPSGDRMQDYQGQEVKQKNSQKEACDGGADCQYSPCKH